MSETAATAGSKFEAVVKDFAAKIGSDYETVAGVFTAEAVNDRTDASLTILADPDNVSDEDFGKMFPKSTFAGAKTATLKSAVRALREAVNPPPSAPPAVPMPASGVPVMGTAAPGLVAPMVQLKQLADEGSFLSALVTGGRLNGTVKPEDAAAATRVAMYQSIGLYDVPKRMVERIEATAEALETPASADVYDLIDSITEREYSHLLKALGAPLRAVGAGERERFIKRLDATLWPGLRRFFASLSAWYEGYKTERSDPSLLVSAITGGLGGLVPVVATDTGALRSAAADLMTMTNRLFMGLTAIPVARAMALDAARIMSQLNDDKYVRACGYATRDEMLRGLGVSVTEQFARNERALATFVINAMDIPNWTDAQLPAFGQHLYILGRSLDWDALGTPRVSGPLSEGPVQRRREPTRGDAKFAKFPGDETYR